jgi:hypothetical protein
MDKLASGLSALDTDTVSSLSPLLGGLTSIGQNKGLNFYDKTKLGETLSRYGALTDTEAQDLFKRANMSVDKLASAKGTNFYDKDALSGVYDALPDVGQDINGVKVIGALPAILQPGGGNGFQDPRGVVAGHTYYSDPWGYAHETQRVKGTPYYFIPKSNFDATRSGTANTWYSPASTEGLYGYNYNGQDGLVFDPSKTNLSWTPERNNSQFAERKSGGGILGFLNNLTEKYDPIGNFVTNTDAKNAGFDNRLDMVSKIGEPVGNILGAVFSGGVPWGSILMAAQNASTGDWNAVGRNAINGLASYASSNVPTGSVAGTGVSLGSNAANAAANQALLSAAVAAARGQDGNQILTSALMSGLGTYGGNLAGNFASDFGSLGKAATSLGYNSLAGGLSSLARGGNFTNGMKLGALNSASGIAANAISNSLGLNSGPLSGVTNGVAKTLLANKLYGGKN